MSAKALRPALSVASALVQLRCTSSVSASAKTEQGGRKVGSGRGEGVLGQMVDRLAGITAKEGDRPRIWPQG